jgi:hypothetical protein
MQRALPAGVEPLATERSGNGDDSMKIVFTLTAAVLTTAALSLPVYAGTIGCKSDQPNASIKASDCRTWHQSRSARVAPARRGTASFAYAPRSRTLVRPARIVPSDDEGVKGGAAN